MSDQILPEAFAEIAEPELAPVFRPRKLLGAMIAAGLFTIAAAIIAAVAALFLSYR